MNVPNIISLARLVAVPVIVMLILRSVYDWAFILFVIAGISDAADGYIAKRTGQISNLGSYLDPLADKALLVGVYLTLGHQGRIDELVVVVVVFRDLMIVGGVLLLMMFRQQSQMHPALVSKINTATQLLLATLMLAVAGLDFEATRLVDIMSYCVVATTLLSGGWYLVVWGRQMTSMEDTR